MASVIKAEDRGRARQTVAFNFDDMAVRADEYLQQVRAEAAKIIAEARQEGARLKRQAEAEGRREGTGAVEQMVAQQLGRQLATLRPALEQAVREIHHAKQAWLQQWEKGAVRLAGALASRLVRRELPKMPDLPVTLVREALELAAGNADLKIRLSPDDHAALASQIQFVVRELAPLAQAELIADPQITAGGCRVETRFGVIDQQLESQLARMEEELV